jgi:hypothetical protein
MFVLSTRRSRARAEREAETFRRAQSIVDVVWTRITGQTPVPAADEVYRVVPNGRRFDVVCVDPSAR